MGEQETQNTVNVYGKVYARLKSLVKTYPRLSVFVSLFFCLGLIFLFFIQSVAWGLWGYMPTKEELANYPVPQASEVYTVDGVLIGRYFLEDRINASYDSLPQHLVDALIATEDVRFYQHSGVDIKSLFRVFFKTILFQNASSGGGSTLSQQVAKNFYPRKDHSFFSLLLDKVKESIIAQDLEEIYSKKEIIGLYLNTVSFGGNAFGIEIAARNYFNKTCSELSIEESSLLIGILKAPTYYNPINHSKRALGRRNVVLSQMTKYGLLDSLKKDSIGEIPISLKQRKYTHHAGAAPYLREKLRLELAQWCKENPSKEGKYYNLYKDGLKIYTSIHSRLQGYAEESMQSHMKKLQGKFDRHWRGYNKDKASKGLYREQKKRSHRFKSLKRQEFSDKEIDSVFRVKVPMQIFTHAGIEDTVISPRDSILHNIFMLHAGFMAMEPQNGFIRAWVGGINHEYYQFDHVKSRRQTGSAFKPLVYATAIEEGISPCEYISNDKVEHARYDNWSPRNSDNIYGGEYSMQGALTHSVNIAAVNLIMKIGPAKVVELAQKMGLSYDLPKVPALALGSADISLRDMLLMYSVIFNKGKEVRPRYLLRMEDRKGEIIYQDPGHVGGKQIIQEETSTLVSHMLKDVVNRGTARSLRSRYKLPYDLAGKTGTTQEQSDGWFIGSAPGLLAGAWVGADDPRIHFRSLAAGQGAATALPIWASFMKQAYEDQDYTYLKKEKFPTPSQALLKKMDCDAYWFPLNMTEFKAWYAEEFGEEEAPIIP